MLEIEDLRLVRGQRTATYEVRLPHLRLEAGDVLAVTGRSGCGKSTLLEGLGLLMSPAHVARYALGAHGDVSNLLASRDDNRLSTLRAANIGFVLQTGGLLPFLSARDNILLPRRLLRLSLTNAHVEHAVQALELESLLDKHPAALSIGERQRVAFVRAIAHEPSLLLADEPTSALDPENARRLFGLFVELAQRCGTATLVVSHDLDLIQEFGLPSIAPCLAPGLSIFASDKET